MNSSENPRLPGYFWKLSGQEALNSSLSGSSEQENQKFKNIMQEERKEAEGGILRERPLNIEFSQQDFQTRDDPKSLDLNFLSQQTSKTVNPQYSPKRLPLSYWAKSGTSGERACIDPMKFVVKDLNAVRNLNLNTSSIAQMSRKWDSNNLNEFDSQIAWIGKRMYSQQHGKEKLKALIAKELESFVRTEKIGQGSFGEVELVFHKETKKFYAMKKIPKNKEPFNREAAEREYLALKKLIEYDDPDLLQVRNVFYTPGESLIVIMEYGRGTLKDLLDFLKDIRNDPLDPSLWKERDLHILYHQLFNQVRKLAKIGLLHGDIKPDNIIVRDNGSFVLSDYGFAFTAEDYNEEQLDANLKDCVKNIDIDRIIQVIQFVIQEENLDIKEREFSKVLDSSLANQVVSFYASVRDQYKIARFKYPFKDIEKAYDNILKFIAYFNTEEIVKYLQAEFENTPPHDHKKLQAFYVFSGEILHREGYVRLAYPRFQESERHLIL